MPSNPTPAFKIGDRVRVLKPGVCCGEVGFVVVVKDDKVKACDVADMGDDVWDWAGWFKPSELTAELAPNATIPAERVREVLRRKLDVMKKQSLNDKLDVHRAFTGGAIFEIGEIARELGIDLN